MKYSSAVKSYVLLFKHIDQWKTALPVVERNEPFGSN